MPEGLGPLGPQNGGVPNWCDNPPMSWGIDRGLNGRRLAEEASRRLPGVKILFISGYAKNAIVRHGLLDHGVELLAKPFTMDSLARKLDQVLQSTGSC